MDICKVFDNVINKDFMTYDSIFNEIVDCWYFNKDENVLILSDDKNRLNNLLYEILKKNKRIHDVIVRLYSDKCLIEAVAYSHRLERDIYLNLNIMDINMFSSFPSRGMKCTDVIIDVNAKNLRDVELPFGENVIYENIYPMMVIPKVSRDNFITLLY